MPQYLTPGVYVEEVMGGARPIEGVGTNVAAFVGRLDAPATSRPACRPPSTTGPSSRASSATKGPSSDLALAVHGFFLNGGQRCYVLNLGPTGTLTGTPSRPGYRRPRSHRRDRHRRRAGAHRRGLL